MLNLQSKLSKDEHLGLFHTLNGYFILFMVDTASIIRCVSTVMDSTGIWITRTSTTELFPV